MATYSWADININLEKDRNGDIIKNINIEAIKNSIGNIFTTLQGSRRMLPEFALPIQALLFEPLDIITARNIGIELLRAIKDWETRLIVENINVWPNEDYNRYDVILTFRVAETNEQATYTTFLYPN